MYKEMWTINDLLMFIRTCYVLPCDFNPSKELSDADREKYGMKLRRTIRTELKAGRDYIQRGRRYYFSDKQAKHSLYTNSTINDYFLREMATLEGDKDFIDYFDRYTDDLYDRNVDSIAQYTSELADEFASNGEVKYVYVPSTNDYKMHLLISGIFDESIENVFSYFGIDGDAYNKAFQDMQKLVNDDIYPPEFSHANRLAKYPYNRSYGYHYYKLMRPLFYYRKDSYYIREKPYLG